MLLSAFKHSSGEDYTAGRGLARSSVMSVDGQVLKINEIIRVSAPRSET